MSAAPALTLVREQHPDASAAARAAGWFLWRIRGVALGQRPWSRLVRICQDPLDERRAAALAGCCGNEGCSAAHECPLDPSSPWGWAQPDQPLHRDGFELAAAQLCLAVISLAWSTGDKSQPAVLRATCLRPEHRPVLDLGSAGLCPACARALQAWLEGAR